MKSDLSVLESIKAPFATTVAQIDSIPALVEAGEKASYDEGYTAGQASIVLPSPDDPNKQYTQADMDKLAEVVRGENDTEVANLQANVDSLNAQITDLNTKLMAAGPDAVKAFKAELKAKYEEQQVAETTGETGFSSLLVD